MPQGFGYGSIGKALSAVQGFAGRYAKEAATVGAPGARAAQWLSSASMSKMNLTGLGAYSLAGSISGSMYGGAYGAVSDQTSVLGGMARGAAFGAVGGAALGRYGAPYMASRAGGATRKQSFAAAYNVMARDSGALIGGTQRKVINPIRSTLKGFTSR